MSADSGKRTPSLIITAPVFIELGTVLMTGRESRPVAIRLGLRSSATGRVAVYSLGQPSLLIADKASSDASENSASAARVALSVEYCRICFMTFPSRRLRLTARHLQGFAASLSSCKEDHHFGARATIEIQLLLFMYT